MTTHITVSPLRILLSGTRGESTCLTDLRLALLEWASTSENKRGLQVTLWEEPNNFVGWSDCWDIAIHVVSPAPDEESAAAFLCHDTPDSVTEFRSVQIEGLVRFRRDFIQRGKQRVFKYAIMNENGHRWTTSAFQRIVALADSGDYRLRANIQNVIEEMVEEVQLRQDR